MLGVIRALIATVYLFQVSLTGLLTAFAFDKAFTFWVFSGTYRRWVGLADSLASGLAENPLHMIAFKLIAILLTNIFGGFNYALSRFVLFIDVLEMAGLIGLFIESLREKEVIEGAIKDIRGDESSVPLESILSARHLKLLWNPVWSPNHVNLFPNITYATNEETVEAITTTGNDFNQPRKMVLDVYSSSSSTRSALRPVLMHIHGGRWQLGTKNIFYPHEKMLLENDDWVIVNISYRLAPDNAYPTHLKDVKRALRWIRQNIESFGGDPNFVILSGDSAGGHLAAMAAFTANDPEYQSGFETIDTSVKGVITFNGALDIHSDTARAEFFARKVALLDNVDTDFLSKHSPVDIVAKNKEKGKNFVPCLVFASGRDALVDCSIGQAFKRGYDRATYLKDGTAQCYLVQLPAAHHIFYAGWSPRSLYSSKLIQVWCRQLHAKNK